MGRDILGSFADNDGAFTAVLEPAAGSVPIWDDGMISRADGDLKCVTWASVPPRLACLIHLVAALQTAKGGAADGREIRAGLDALAAIRRTYSFETAEYTAVAEHLVDRGPRGERTLPRDVLSQVITEYLDDVTRRERVTILASPKVGVPLRAWLPAEVVARMRKFCHRRCTRTAFFITAASHYFAARGVDISDP